MKNIKINDTKNGTTPVVGEEQILGPEQAPQVVPPDEQLVHDLFDNVDELVEETSKPKPDADLTLKTIEELEPAKANSIQENGSSLSSIPLVDVNFGETAVVDSVARELAFNLTPLPVVQIYLPPPEAAGDKHSAPIANPFDGDIHELFLDAREFIHGPVAFLATQSNELPTPLPFPDASGEKFASPEGPIGCTHPIAIYGNYIEGFTSPGAGASSVQIVSMNFNNQVYTPDASGKIVISTADGQLVMYTKDAGLQQDFPGDNFKPGFFYYEQSSNAIHAPDNGENLLDHDMFITIANNFGLTATAAFNVHIVDDVPIAHDDTVKLLQDSGLVENQIVARDATPGLPVNQVSGNLLANDDFSVDGKNLINQVTYKYDGSSHTADLINGAINFDTDFGHVTIDAKGHYTYKITADLSNDHVTEDLIKYQMIDKDGDTSSADLLMRMAPAPVITIVPNDSDLGVGDLTVKEGTDPSVQYKVVVTGVLLEDLSLNVATQDNTAFATGTTPGTPDYTAISTNITVSADEVNSLHEVALPPSTIVDDKVFENLPETFNTIVDPIQGTISSSSDTTAVTTIIDDDPPPKISIQSQLSVTEGNPVDPTHYATLTITMTGSSQDPVTFHYQTQDGTAIGGSTAGVGNPDYVPISGDITFGSSFDDTQTATIKVPIIDDYTYERLVNQQETFTVNLTPVNLNGAVITNPTSTVTIVDDDLAPYVKIIGGSISENGGSFLAQVELFGSSTEALSFSYSTSNGTAVSSGSGPGQPDYDATSGSITFNPAAATGENALSQTVNISIPIVNDSTYEGTTPENFTINLTPQGYVAGPPASLDLASSTLSATVNIVDDDNPPTLSVGSASVSEAAGGVNVAITREGGTTEAISFKLSTADITAIAGSDYTGLNPNTVYTIAAGNGNASVNVFIPILNDSIPEPTETFGVNISQITAGTVSSTSNGVVTIIDDDIAAKAVNDNVTVDPSTFPEYNITFVLDISGSMNDAVSVGGPTRLDVLKAALANAGNLLDTYSTLSSELHVNIITFSNDATLVTHKDINNASDLDDVKNDINNLAANGSTNYNQGLDEAMDRFDTDSQNNNLNGYINRSYFISDGQPSDPPIENATWQAALNQYGVESFTANISAGTVDNTYLDPLATQSHTPLTFTAANDLSNLNDFLLSTIAVSGNVLANDTVGTFGPGSVISYTYDNGLHSGIVGQDIITDIGGKFVLNADGSYNYIPPGDNSTPVDEIFHYTIQDPGGNVSSADLDLHLLAFTSPIVLDLNHDGNIGLTSAANSGVGFDVNHDGVKEQLGWVSPQDGILVYDPTDSGKVTDINQISFTSYLAGAKTDLQGLSAFDTNHDGKLDAGDQAYTHFGVWQDSNSNGIVDPGEYQTLDQASIKSLSLTSDNNKESVSGNTINGFTTFQSSDGQSHLAADVALSVGSSIPNNSANNTINTNDVLPTSNTIDFSSLPQSNSQASSAPAAAASSVAAAPVAAPAPVQVEASVTAALVQPQHETAALHPA